MSRACTSAWMWRRSVTPVSTACCWRTTATGRQGGTVKVVSILDPVIRGIMPRMQHDSFDAWHRHIGTDTRTASSRQLDPRQIEVPALTILYHPDPERVGERAPLLELTEGRSVEISRLGPGFVPVEGGEHRPLADPRLSRRPIRISPREHGLGIDASATNTKLEVDGESAETFLVIDKLVVRRGVVLFLGRHVVLLLHMLLPVIRRLPDFGLIGEGSEMLELRQDIARVADLDVPVLLRGESGTGKEMVAQAIQSSGPRCDRPFLSINVGAVPPSLAAAELFGTIKGAYSGADRNRRGYFQRADGGTLFLDEIGEAPPELQAPLLRVLETGEIQPVGAQAPLRVDVRVVAATDADLEKAAAQGTFKAPLLHRLNGYEITLPPLRRRLEDIGRLFFYFLRHELRQLGEEERLQTLGPYARPWVPAKLVARLAAYAWPGNVRQLRNVTRQLAIANRGKPEIQLNARLEALLAKADDRSLEREPALPSPPAEPIEKRRPERLSVARYRDPGDVGDEELIVTLRRNRWNIKPTAEQLGVSRSSLYDLIEQCPRIRKASDLGREEIEACLERCGQHPSTMAEELEVSKQGLKIRMKELGLR